MEEYLQYMKTLRSHINDVEDQAAKVSVEEQTHITTIHTMEKDISSAKSEIKKLKDETEAMMKSKAHICSNIIHNHKKISTLDSDSSALSQTLELIQQERLSLSTKLAAKSSYYSKVAEDAKTKLQQQQDWFHSHNISGEMRQHGLNDETRKRLMELVDSAKAKLNQITQMKSNLILENNKMKQSIENMRCKANDFKPELLSMDIKVLEEGYKALLSDKSGEMDYLLSLQSQIEKLKGISNVTKCSCGEEYKVGTNPCA